MYDNKLSATNMLIVINVCVSIVGTILTLTTGHNILFMGGAKYTPLIIQGEYWRLITPIFLHSGLMHLFMNLYSLFLLGPFVENTFGIIRYLLIYFFSGIVGNAASALFLPDTVSVGASGAIFGLLGTWLYLGLKYKSQLPVEFLGNVISMIVINIFYGLIQSNIDNYAHLGGLVSGFLITLIIDTFH